MDPRTIRVVLDLGITSPDPAEQCTQDELLRIAQAYETCKQHGDVIQYTHEFVLLRLAPHHRDYDEDWCYARLCLVEDCTRCGVGIKRIENENGDTIWK